MVLRSQGEAQLEEDVKTNAEEPTEEPAKASANTAASSLKIEKVSSLQNEKPGSVPTEKPSSSGSGEQSNQDASSSGPAPSSGSKDVPANSEAKDGASENPDPELDVTNLYFKKAIEKGSHTKVGPTSRQRFLDCELVVPATTLKKFKQLDPTEYNISNYVGVLAQDRCKMYKTFKPRLCAMMMGDFMENQDSFWSLVVRQCKNQPAGAFFFFDTFAGDQSQAWNDMDLALATAYMLAGLRKTLFKKVVNIYAA